MSAIVANCAINLRCELTKPVKVEYIDGNMFSMDNAGNTAHVYIYYNGQPQEVVGSVSAEVIRPDGGTVAVTGAMSGNRAYVIFPQAVYAIPGMISCVIKITEGTTTTTIAAFVANVYRSSTDQAIDPGQLISSISSLISAIETAVGSIPADYSSLLATIAGTYSSSKTYNVGDYAWESGVLKRCIVPITAGETFTAAHWTNAVVCDDLSALKSALQSYNSVDLLSGLLTKTTGNSRGVDFVWSGDVCTINGTNNSQSDASLNSLTSVVVLPANVVPGETYYAKFNASGDNVKVRIVFRDSNGTSLYKTAYITEDRELTIPSDAVKWDIKLMVDVGETADHVVVSEIALLNTCSNKDLTEQLSGLNTETAMRLMTSKEADEITNILDIPANRYYTFSGSRLVEGSGTPGDPDYVAPLISNPPDGITAGNSYVVRVWKYTNTAGYKICEIFRASDVKHYFGVTYSGHTDAYEWYDRSYNDLYAVADNLQDEVDNLQDEVDCLFDDFDSVFECYTDFEEITYWWNSTGGYSANASLVHTQKFKVRPNTDYYCTMVSNNTCLGAFFDAAGNWIAPLLLTDFTDITPSYGGGANTYVPDNNAYAQDGSAPSVANYMTFKKFTTPANARYFSFNCTKTADRYRQCICSKLVYLMNASGNYRIFKDDDFYQKFKDKKLCVIGSSTIMIDRLYRSAKGDRYVAGEQTEGYISGFQEYLRPYFAEVRGLGHSGAAFAKGRGSATGQCSIYTRICGGTESFTYDGTSYEFNITAPDLSGYDVFIVVTKDANGLTNATIGNYTDETADTYSGAIRLICEKIQTDNPKAVIYFMPFQPAILTGDSKTMRVAANTQMKLLAEEQAYGWIGESVPGYSTVNFDLYSYDGTHFNCEGNRMFAEYVKKQLIGF